LYPLCCSGKWQLDYEGLIAKVFNKLDNWTRRSRMIKAQKLPNKESSNTTMHENVTSLCSVFQSLVAHQPLEAKQGCNDANSNPWALSFRDFRQMFLRIKLYLLGNIKKSTSGGRLPPRHCTKKKSQPSRSRKPPEPQCHSIGLHRNLSRPRPTGLAITATTT